MSPVKIDGKIRLASKSGPTPFSKRIEREYLESNVKSGMKFYEFCEEWLSRDFTPIFEWISPKDVVVLEYEVTDLILIAIRHNVSGEYVLYPAMEESAKKYQIPIVPLWNKGKQMKDIQEFMHTLKMEQKIEGCVVWFETGEIYKIKTE